MAAIPHGSGNEKALSDWIVAFAKSKQLSVYQDSYHNLLIKKPASKGYEAFSPLILQGHIDMVNEKDEGCLHDFEKDALKLKTDGTFLMADGTTLGADNGIGVAFILAFLADDGFEHPAIEALLTTQEETTMNGAKNFDYSLLSGHHLISLDHTKEGEMLTACADFTKIDLTSDFGTQTISSDYKLFEVSLTGLKGGHSGEDIIERRSAFDFMRRTILQMVKETDALAVSFSCGTKSNAIARSFKVVLAVPTNKQESLFLVCRQLEEIFNKELLNYQEKIKLDVADMVLDNCIALTKEETARLSVLLSLLPNGVQTVSEFPTTAESSLNAGISNLKEGCLSIDLAIRSNISSLGQVIVNKIKLLAGVLGARTHVQSEAPQFISSHSDLARCCAKTYFDMYDKEIVNRKIHAGVEGGIFQQKMPNIEIILISPDLFDIHSPSERVNIQSAERTWDFFVGLIKAIRFPKEY